MAKQTVIDRAKDRFKRISDATAYARDIGKSCLEFVGGEQWEPGEINTRKLTDRPMLTINKLANYLNLVVNKNVTEMAMVKAVPFEDADADTAKVVNGLLMHIQHNSKSPAKRAYANAFFDLVSCGYGFWRVDTEYCDEMSVDEQEIIIRGIENPHNVLMDKERRFCFVVTFMTREDFEEQYPGKSPGEWDSGSTVYDNDDNETAMIVEYFERTEKPVKIFKIEIPEVIYEPGPASDIDQAIQTTMMQQAVDQVPPRVFTVTEEGLNAVDDEGLPVYPQYTVISERTTEIPQIKRYIFSGDETLSEDDLPGKYIPIVGIFSREFKTRNGDRYWKPLIYDAIDPQRLLNFARTQDAEIMNLAPKCPWIGAEGQFDGHEEEFSRANIDHVPYLEYKAVTVDGHVVPPPQRVMPPLPSQGYYQNAAQATDEIKSTIGMYDASIGATSNEQSGRAILARQRQGDMSTAHFTEAGLDGILLTGAILVDLIPHIYDSARTIRILGDDMADEVVKINQQFVDKDGKQVLYDLTTGKYDIKIDAGASSLTRRMDAAENLLEFARVVPQAGALSGDYIAKNLDFEYADDLALRLKAALPPELLERVEMLERGEDGSAIMQKMQAMQQQLQKAMQALQGMGKENEQLKRKMSGDDLEKENIRANAGIMKAQIGADAGIDRELIRQRGNIPMPPGAAPRW
jgi:hypothetical protein